MAIKRKNASKYARKRTVEEKLQDRVLITKLLAARKTHWEITQAINDGKPAEQHISRQQVSSDIKAMRKAWTDEVKQRGDDIIGRDLMVIEQLEREAWEAWEKSKKEQVKKSTRKNSDGGGGEYTTMTASTLSSYGDPRFLAEIRSLIAERAKLLGIYAPEKKLISGKVELTAVPENAEILDKVQEVYSLLGSNESD